MQEPKRWDGFEVVAGVTAWMEEEMTWDGFGALGVSDTCLPCETIEMVSVGGKGTRVLKLGGAGLGGPVR